MDLIVLRHGPAEPRSLSLAPDEERARPLTSPGRRRTRRSARAIRELCPQLDAIASSALPRALQTAELLGRAYGGLDPVELVDLAPGGSREGVVKWLAQGRPDGALAIVGHNPDLPALVCWLLAGVSTPFLTLSKAGACLLRFESQPGPATAELRWSLPGRVLEGVG